MTTYIDHLTKWDQDISSLFLEYSHNSEACCRCSNVGPTGESSRSSYNAFATCCPFSYRTCLTVILESAPFRSGCLSFGLACVDALCTMERGFGNSAGTWGLNDRRDSMGPCEFFASGRKCNDAGCRTLSSGDVLSIDVNHTNGTATLFLNSRKVAGFTGIPLNAALVIGVCVVDGHALRITRGENMVMMEDEDEDIYNGINDEEQEDVMMNERLLIRQQHSGSSSSTTTAAGGAGLVTSSSDQSNRRQITQRQNNTNTNAINATISALEDLTTVITPVPSSPPPRPSLDAIIRNSPFQPHSRTLQNMQQQQQQQSSSSLSTSATSAGRMVMQSQSMINLHSSHSPLSTTSLSLSSSPQYKL